MLIIKIVTVAIVIIINKNFRGDSIRVINEWTCRGLHSYVRLRIR